jgi:Cdc6-like AAA superfamily ATPase
MVTISNTIDFPERLEEKILSRIGNQRLVFSPYTSG